MKKRFASILLIVCMVLTLLPATASAGESFNNFVDRMRSEYDVIISCDRSIPLTAKEQGYIETALSAWGKEYVRTISGAFASSKYFGSTETLSSTRMKIIISNLSGDAEAGLYGKASGEKLYLYGDIWDDVTFHHEFAHMVKHACESASSVNCYGKFSELIKAANSDAISVSGDYKSAWKPGVDESFYAWSYGKYSPDEDIATIMPNTTDSKWAEKVKNGEMPVITKKLQAFRNYYEKYLTGGSIPCPLIDNILGPSTNHSTEAMGTYFNLITTKMNAGETFKLEIIGSYPITATERFEITSIRSMDPKIIKVDQNTGIITALSEGSTLVSYGFKTATQTSNIGFTITVTGSVLPTDVRFDFPTTLKVGDKFKPTITLLPEGSIAPAEPRWSYSTNQVITFKDGELIAQRPGKSTLTCLLDHMDLKVPVEITVEAATVTGITLNETSVTKTAGSTIQLKPTLEPAGSNGAVTYSSSDESVATVNTNGLVTTKKAGTATITAKVGTLTATCTVTVTPAAVAGISLAPAQAGIKVGHTVQLEHTFIPAGAVGTVNYTTSDASVAAVSGTGLVTGKKTGTATIIVKSGNFFATSKITVSNTDPTGITLGKATATVEAGKSIQLTAALTPAGAGGTVTYSSSDTGVATVSAAGLVTGKKAGTATITAKVGTLSTTCKITVTSIAPTGITMSRANATVEAGKTIQLTAALTPAGAGGTVTYSSSDTGVATVSAAGLVTGKKAGTTTITAKVGALSTTCKITVTSIAPTGITLGKTTATLEAGKTIQLTAALTPVGAGGTVTYSSSDTGVATVSAAGLVTGKKAGTTTITAKVGALSTTCKITVTSIAPTGITLGKATATVEAGKSIQLTAALTPAGAGGTVTYSSSDTGVATVSAAGLVTGKKAGTTTITAKVGTLSTTCKITVTAALETTIAGGWYNLRVMNNYINISAAGNAELRSNTKNQAFYVDNKGGMQVTLKTVDGKYLGVSGTVKDGVQLKEVDSPYIWNIYSEKKTDIFSLRPPDKVKMVVNASGQNSEDGTQIILWTHENLDAPNHAEIRFITTQAPGAGTAKHPFNDVPKGTYYENPVIWALNNGVTSGTSATNFAPGETCTRGQVVTFLWRAKGSPEPASTVNPFSDVKASDYFYKAVLWAVEKGITSGTSATTFSPNSTCTSGQVVTFLWRSNGSPKATGTSSLAAQYSGQYYSDAVAWVDSTGLLAGTGTAFAPNSNSPRADIVTYLYRNAGSPAIQ